MDEKYKIVTFRDKYFALICIKTDQFSIHAPRGIKKKNLGTIKTKNYQILKLIKVYLIDSSAMVFLPLNDSEL